MRRLILLLFLTGMLYETALMAEPRTITTSQRGKELIGTVHILPGQEHTYRAFVVVKSEDLEDCASDYITVTITAKKERVKRSIPGVTLYLHVATQPDTPLGTYFAPVAMFRHKDHEGNQSVEPGELRIIVVDQLPSKHGTLAKWIRGSLGILIFMVVAVIFFGMLAYFIIRIIAGAVGPEEPDDEEEETEEEEEIDDEFVQEALNATTDGHPPDEVV